MFRSLLLVHKSCCFSFFLPENLCKKAEQFLLTDNRTEGDPFLQIR